MLSGAARSDLGAERATPGAIVVELPGQPPPGLALHVEAFAGDTRASADFSRGRARVDGLDPGVYRLHVRRPPAGDGGGPATFWIPVPRSGAPEPTDEVDEEVRRTIDAFMAAWRDQDVERLATHYHPDYRGASDEDLERRLELLRWSAAHTEMLGFEHRAVAIRGDAKGPLAWIESVSLARDLASGRVSPRRTLMQARLGRKTDGSLGILRTERGWLPADAIAPASTVHYVLESPLAQVEVSAGTTLRLELDWDLEPTP